MLELMELLSFATVFLETRALSNKSNYTISSRETETNWDVRQVGHEYMSKL